MKRLIIVRHAHRELTDRSLDNGISEKGVEQAKEFTSWFLKENPLLEKLPSSPQLALASSPKLRCIETLEYLSRSLRKTIQVENALDEQRSGETHSAFVKRIQAFTEALKTRPEKLFVLCSHGDWIPVACDLISSQNVDLGKGKWIELTLNP